MDYSAVTMKKRKDEKAIQQKPSGTLSANTGTTGEMITADQPKSRGIITSILKDVSKKDDEREDATPDAVTYVGGEKVEWKAGKNPAYEERLIKLRKKAK